MSAIGRPSWHWLVVVGVVALLIVGVAAGARYLRQHSLADIYQVEVQQQVRRSQQIDGATVFFGDSQTARFAASSVAAHTENFGITGDILDRALWRVPRYRLTGAKTFVIEFGINDYWLHVTDGFGLKYKNLLNLLPAGVPVIAIAIFPITAEAANTLGMKDALQAIPALNAQIAAACRQRPNCRFVDLAKSLRGPNGYLRPQYAETDGIHLSTAGYRIWSAALKPILS